MKDKKSYYRIKTVDAYPSTLGEYADRKGFIVEPSVRDMKGYVIQYIDHLEWLPTRQFNLTYRSAWFIRTLGLVGLVMDKIAVCAVLIYLLVNY